LEGADGGISSDRRLVERASLLALFRLPLSRADFRATAVLVDELDAGSL
jgi:hypothetical protein